MLTLVFGAVLTIAGGSGAVLGWMETVEALHDWSSAKESRNPAVRLHGHRLLRRNVLRIAIVFASAIAGLCLILLGLFDFELSMEEGHPELIVLGVLACTYTILTALNACIDRRARRQLVASLDAEPEDDPEEGELIMLNPNR